MSDSTVKRIFVSYAREDFPWKQALLDEPPEWISDDVQVMTDIDIKTGQEWDPELRRMIHDADLAILLVSPHYLKPRYAFDVEYREIQSRYRERTLEILWIPIGPDVGDEFLRNLEAARKLIDFLPRTPQNINQCREAKESLWRAVRGFVDPDRAALESVLRPAGRYHVKRRLGKSLWTTVYAVEDELLDRTVVIKVLSGSGTTDYRDTFIQLARKANAVTHPNIITLLDACLKTNPIYMVTQYITNATNLRQLLTHNAAALSLEEAINIVRSVGEILRQAHAKGEAFVNVKPSNIVLSEGRDPFLSFLSAPQQQPDPMYPFKKRVADIGRRLQEQGSLGSEELACFLPEHCEPRIATADPNRSDQYLLGLVAYELLTRKLPETWSDIVALERGRDAFKPLVPLAEVRADCPADLARAIMRMTRLNPRERFDSFDEALRPFRQTKSIGLRVAKDSYRRCIDGGRKLEFFEKFYGRFLDKCKEARPRFAHFRDSQQWAKQYQLLMEAVLWLFAYSEWATDGEEPTVLTRIAEKHGKDHLQIPSKWFDRFADALIEVVLETDGDGRSDEERANLREAWSQTIGPGIKYMKRKSE